LGPPSVFDWLEFTGWLVVPQKGRQQAQTLT